VSKGVEDGHKSPDLQAGCLSNGRKAVSGVSRPQGIKGSGMTGWGKTLGIPWPPTAIRPWILIDIQMICLHDVDFIWFILISFGRF
jgi:hypothetical protein